MGLLIVQRKTYFVKFYIKFPVERSVNPLIKTLKKYLTLMPHKLSLDIQEAKQDTCFQATTLEKLL